MITPARTLFDLLGVDTVSEICGVTRGQALRWEYPKSRGGADGYIPHKHHAKLLSGAAERGVRLEPSDLMPWLKGAA